MCWCPTQAQLLKVLTVWLLQCKLCISVSLQFCTVRNALRHALRVAFMTDLGFDVIQKDYRASMVDDMRRCDYALSRFMDMRWWLTELNATRIDDTFSILPKDTKSIMT